MATAIEVIKKWLEKRGYEVESYRPGRQRLYRVAKIDKRTGRQVRTVSYFMTASEFKAWFAGFSYGKK